MCRANTRRQPKIYQVTKGKRVGREGRGDPVRGVWQKPRRKKPLEECALWSLQFQGGQGSGPGRGFGVVCQEASVSRDNCPGLERTQAVKEREGFYPLLLDPRVNVTSFRAGEKNKKDVCEFRNIYSYVRVERGLESQGDAFI